MSFFKVLSRNMPDLKLKLSQARMHEEPEHYVKKTFHTALFLTFGLLIVGFAFIKEPVILLFSPLIA